MSDCLLTVRDGDSNELFSMDDMFHLLQGADTLEDPTIVQDLLKEMWKENPNHDLRDKLDQGVAELMDGKHENAVNTFSNIVSSDPLFGEAFNKKATVLYLLGEKDESIKAAEEALKIDARNFQAIAGLGLIAMDRLQYDKAMEYFRQGLSINPWLGSVQSKLFLSETKKDNGPELP